MKAGRNLEMKAGRHSEAVQSSMLKEWVNWDQSPSRQPASSTKGEPTKEEASKIEKSYPPSRVRRGDTLPVEAMVRIANFNRSKLKQNLWTPRDRNENEPRRKKGE
eukprot:Hpha_TRINITY_DN36619_c0_g1::TRINITY_DN36619_c0_g1_i1::g.18768::m.18768